MTSQLYHLPKSPKFKHTVSTKISKIQSQASTKNSPTLYNMKACLLAALVPILDRLAEIRRVVVRVHVFADVTQS